MNHEQGNKLYILKSLLPPLCPRLVLTSSLCWRAFQLSSDILWHGFPHSTLEFSPLTASCLFPSCPHLVGLPHLCSAIFSGVGPTLFGNASPWVHSLEFHFCLSSFTSFGSSFIPAALRTLVISASILPVDHFTLGSTQHSSASKMFKLIISSYQ